MCEVCHCLLPGDILIAHLQVLTATLNDFYNTVSSNSVNLNFHHFNYQYCDYHMTNHVQHDQLLIKLCLHVDERKLRRHVLQDHIQPLLDKTSHAAVVETYSWQIKYWCNTCTETTVRIPQRIQLPIECGILGHQSGIMTPQILVDLTEALHRNICYK